ncbi:MAG: hypothetical protein LBL81_04050 [Tannerella sp.]|jgi:alpha-N-arabinofuranosidase|nr:hypothetical protein [Tannerella sp.]
MAATRFAEQTVVITQGLIREAMTKVHRRTPIYIAYDEYNASWRNRTFNLEDALVVATYLNIFVRHADVVKMANMAQLVNLLAPIMAEKGGVWLQTIYYPLALFSHHCYGRSLEAYVDCPSYSLKSKELVPYLDVSASYDKAKSRVVLNVVNRCKEEAVDAGIECQSGQWNGDGQAYTVDSKNVTDANSLGHEVVKTVEKGFKAEGAMLHYSFPPHSFTQLLIPIKK